MEDKNNAFNSEIVFRPVESDAKITDTYGHAWKQDTACGWIRIVDSFFIPYGPNGPYYVHEEHSVEAMQYKNNRLKKISI